MLTHSAAFRDLSRLLGGDAQVCLLVAEDVASNALAESLWVAPAVEPVVLQLECQSDVGTEAIEDVGILLRSLADDGTHLERAAQEHRSLQAYHLDVFLFSHVVAALKLEIELLTFANLDSGAGEEFKDWAQQYGAGLGNMFESHRQHGIAREDGSVVVPFDVHRRSAAAVGSLVHHVVVQQCEVMVDLEP